MIYYCHKDFPKGLTCTNRTLDGRCMGGICANKKKYPRTEPSRISRSVEEFESIIESLDADGIRLEFASKEGITEILAAQTFEKIRKSMINK